jgi:flagellar basal body-associated protein FliL
MNASLKSIEHSERHGERGAALWTTLVVAMILLSVGGVLLLTTSMSATNSVDSVAETQAGLFASFQVAILRQYQWLFGSRDLNVELHIP